MAEDAALQIRAEVAWYYGIRERQVNIVLRVLDKS